MTPSICVGYKHNENQLFARPDSVTEGVEIHNANLKLAHIRNLRFPLPVRIEVGAGTCEVLLRGYTRTICAGEWRVLPALEPISVTLLHGASLGLKLVSGTPVPWQTNASDLLQGHLALLADDIRQRKPLTAALSAAVFHDPHTDWQLSTASIKLGHCTGRRLAAKLHQEGESFRILVRTQRLVRISMDLMASRYVRSSGAYGFRDRCRLENTLYDHLGISVDALANLAAAPVAATCLTRTRGW